MHDHSNVQDLTSLIEREEIIIKQARGEFCQTIVAKKVGCKGTCFFEDSDVFQCLQNVREPGQDQIVLPYSLKHLVLRLAHYHVQTGHPGQTRMHNRVRRTFYWPQMAAEIATTVHECEPSAKNRIRLLKQANKLRRFPATTPLE